jgi:hypothetical protein
MDVRPKRLETRVGGARKPIVAFMTDPAFCIIGGTMHLNPDLVAML